ncbi:carboxypeptidase-like regulatory domain-containing protein [Actinophytocola gossypii]|uniref:alpha-amylase n=1 Tax=Actinophytocola gossypii TaxID=2812003 RepID=A0ABT2J5V5_9PSEU|nr:carboxypeptidase-like regulatory domain-containing protein [Actinophytocola gossypii]MCT2583061.1 carboxypeptidase regulatory-like domain-containing protein [Actinophytocola gossypii]
MILRSFLPRLGLVAAAAVLGVGAAIGSAAAEPTEHAVPSEPAVPTGSVPVGTPSETPEATPSGTVPSETPAGDDVAPRRIAELEVLVEFDKASYRTGETMSIRFEVANLLDEPARDITVSYDFMPADAIEVDLESWGQLDDGVDIPAGGSHVVTLTGRVGNPDVTSGVLAGYLYDTTGNSVRQFRHTVPVTPTFGHASGIVYADGNDNGRFDAGEGLPGAVVTANNQVDWDGGDTYEATTGADGSFTFPRLPTVRMMLSTVAPGDWLVGNQFVTIDLSDSNDGLRLRGARPLTDLAASLAFTEDVYRVGEHAEVQVKLVNDGANDLTGIVAQCNGSGHSAGLQGTGTGWGALAGGGVTVPAGSTVDLTVTDVVPRAAFEYGRVTVGCSFTYRNVWDERSPNAFDDARVPGGFGRLEGVVTHYPGGYGEPGVGVPDARVVLVTDAACPTVTEARTDDEGRYAFRRLPTGNHDLYVLPPDGWQVVGEYPYGVSVLANSTASVSPEVTPGDAAPPELPAPPADCADEPGQPGQNDQPDAQGRPAPVDRDLAHTGVNVVGLMMAGLGAVGAGFGGLVAGRRRRA